MSRWGQEEKKSKGLFTFAIFGGIFLLTAYLFFINYQRLEERRLLEEGMQKIVRNGLKKTKKEMEDEILLFANNDLGLPLTNDQLELTIGQDAYSNKVVDVWIEYKFEVDLLAFSFEVEVPISEELTLMFF